MAFPSFLQALETATRRPLLEGSALCCLTCESACVLSGQSPLDLPCASSHFLHAQELTVAAYPSPVVPDTPPHPRSSCLIHSHALCLPSHPPEMVCPST